MLAWPEITVTAEMVGVALFLAYVVGVCVKLALASVDQDQHYRDMQPDWPPHPRPAELEWKPQ